MDVGNGDDVADASIPQAESDGLRGQVTQKQINGEGNGGSTAEKVRQDRVRIFELLDQGRIEDPALHMLAPDFQMNCEKSIGPYTYCGSRGEFIHHYLEVLQARPGYYFNLTQCTVKLSDSNRRASAMLSGETGAGDLQIQVVNVLTWQLRKLDGWVCVRGKCIRALFTDNIHDASND